MATKKKITCFCLCIFTSIWTILQGCAYLTAVMFGYHLIRCNISPSLNSGFFLLTYLTYFYQKNCTSVLEESLITSEPNVIFKYFFYEDDTETVLSFINDIVENGVLPDESNAFFRTKIFIDALFVMNCLWIISGVALAMGALFRIEGKFSLFFYCPWLLESLSMLILDFYLCSRFLNDFWYVSNVSDWLNFVGITNVNVKKHQKIPDIFFAVPSMSASLICGRFFIIWFINLVLLIFMFKITKKRYNKKSIPPSRIIRPTAHNLKSSEARIRTWQMFYGAIGSTSSRSGSVDTTNNAIDLNSNNNPTLMESAFQAVEMSTIYPDETFRPPVNVTVRTNSYEPFDKVEVVEEIEKNTSTTNNINNKLASNNPPEELRSELPWSYFDKNNKLIQDVKLRNQTDSQESVPKTDNQIKRISTKNRIRFENISERIENHDICAMETSIQDK